MVRNLQQVKLALPRRLTATVCERLVANLREAEQNLGRLEQSEPISRTAREPT